MALGSALLFSLCLEKLTMNSQKSAQSLTEISVTHFCSRVTGRDARTSVLAGMGKEAWAEASAEINQLLSTLVFMYNLIF